MTRHSHDPHLEGILRAIDHKLIQIIKKQEATLAELDDLKAQVAANHTVIESAVTLINGIADRIKAAGTDPAALKALTDDLKSEDDALAKAVTANTPTPPAP